MTDEQITSGVIQWINGRLKHTVIRGNQGGERPALPYLSVTLTRVQAVRQWQQENEWTEMTTTNSTGNIDLLMTPLLEQEWEFSVSSYGTDPTQLLRKLESLARDPQHSWSLFAAGFHVYEIGQINHIPEFINAQWEPRAQCYLILRGVTRDGDIADTIEDIDETVFTPV